MKPVACVLTLLLALGSQARAVQSDAPFQLDTLRDSAMVYLTQVKESALRTLDHLDGTEFVDYKLKLSDSLDKLQEYAQTASQTLTPYGDAVSTPFLEATQQMRERLMDELTDLRTQIEPRRAELHQAIQQQADEYRAKLEPLFQEYVTQGQERVDALRARLQPLMEEMQSKMEASVEDTKAKVLPMVETVRTKMTERLEGLQTMASPYVEEYREHISKAVGDAREKIAPHTQEMQTRLEPYLEDLKARLSALYGTITQAIQA